MRVGDWTWLAIYELKHEAALKSDEYKRAREADGDDESRMFEFLSRRVYTMIEEEKSENYEQVVTSGKSRIMSMAGLQAPEGDGKDTVERFKEEEAQKTFARSGWLRTSSWKLSTAADPRTWEEQTNVPELLVLQEWEDSDHLRASLASAGRARNGPREKALLKHWKQF